MLEIFGYIILAVYCCALVYITIFCLMQLRLLWIYRRIDTLGVSRPDDESGYPLVTIQLPIFNELFVVDRLIDNICALEYPKDKLQIQVLDDSTDNTLELTKKKVKEYRDDGFDIELIHRSDRTGYKAGALANGMKTARGEYIAIFDADFLPKKDFLLRTLPYFADTGVGVVQTRWEHLNRDYSLITKLQAFQLNVHFTVEQSGRQAADYLLQFNGTAGIWRAAAIEDAGGWEADTLTEDLDLSYRAQLKGWTIRYLEDVGSPAELPAEMNGLKSQQFRWMKGGAETARKMIPSVWRSPLSFSKKMHATIHLLSSTIFVFVFVVGVFSVPLTFMIKPLGIDADYFALFLIGLLTIAAVYYVGNARTTWKGENALRSVLKFIFLFPLFLSLSMGLSLHNSVAVIQGYLGKKSAFVRTPKFNIKTIADTFSSGGGYLASRIPLTTVVEGILAFYFLVAIIAALYYDDTTFIIFHLLLTFGYGSICYYSIKHLRSTHS